MTRSTPPAPPQSNIPIDVKEVSPESESCPKPQSPEFHSDLRKNHWTVRAGQERSRTPASLAVPASIVAAMCLVARSHAIVEAIATTRTTRRPILFIIDAISDTAHVSGA